MNFAKITKIFSLITATSFLAACGGGDSNDDNGNPNPPPPVVGLVIGGSVGGLGSNKVIVLQNNGGDDLRIEKNGKFSFAKMSEKNTIYSVTVLTQPQGQLCVVTGGSGIASADVYSVDVQCSDTSNPGTNAIDRLVGRWEPVTCGYAQPGDRHRDFHVYEKTGATSLAMKPGRYEYSGGDCSGGRSETISNYATAKLDLLTIEQLKGYVVYRMQNYPAMSNVSFAQSYTFTPNGLVCLMSSSENFSTAEIVERTEKDIAGDDLANCGKLMR